MCCPAKGAGKAPSSSPICPVVYPPPERGRRENDGPFTSQVLAFSVASSLCRYMEFFLTLQRVPDGCVRHVWLQSTKTCEKAAGAQSSRIISEIGWHSRNGDRAWRHTRNELARKWERETRFGAKTTRLSRGRSRPASRRKFLNQRDITTRTIPTRRAALGISRTRNSADGHAPTDVSRKMADSQAISAVAAVRSRI
jgi:hypothetical protein